MLRCTLALVVALGCASTGARDPDASAICPDARDLVVHRDDRWVTLGCQADPGVPDGPLLTWDREAGRLVHVAYAADGQLNGPSRTWHPNGRLRQESHYVRGSNEGELRMWHDNGQLEVRAHYVASELEGPWVQWREDGSLRRLWHWHEGRLHGPYIVWHPNGRAKIVGGYDHDQKVGRWWFWNASGELERQEDHPPRPASGG